MKSIPFIIKQETDMERYRYNTFWAKEPETIAWIESFNPNDIFFDIGANIGIYSFHFCSLYPNGKCYAFEPSRKNYIRLFENMILNNFKNMLPSPIALSNETGIQTFCETSTAIGSSGGQVVNTITKNHPCVFVTSIDSLISHGIIKNIPNHIKIDVDGQEMKIVEGMLLTLEKKECKSVLVELDLDKTNIPLVVELFKLKGFTINNDLNSIENHSRYRREKEGIRCENVIFTRV